MITITNLKKSFDKLEVLKGINVSIKKGKITYIVGPNAAGKTTMIKSLLGLVKADQGEILINNFKLNGDWHYRENIGYMPQIANFPENLKVEEILKMIKDLRSNTPKYDEELINKFNLKTEFNKRLKNLSGGTRQKVNACIAFLFDPDILILDEPTAGLDPLSSSILKDKILEENEKGKTIVFTSHLLTELERLAQEVIFLLDGRICFKGTITDLISETKQADLERAIASMISNKCV